MEKPWDCLRATVKPPLVSGSWRTSHHHANVQMEIDGTGAFIGLFSNERHDSRRQRLKAPDLRELAEFCNELADQLEGK